MTRTLNEWMPADASDEMQLLAATARGRVIFTFNNRDFVALAQRYPQHGGIVLVAQRRWTLAAMIPALERMLRETRARDWPGQVRWLKDWRD